MRRISSAISSHGLRIALYAGAVAVLSACASDPGEKGVEGPFPKLADVPPKPEAGTTPEERAELKKQLQQRRDQVNRAAASLLRGGTEPVPVSLESRLPAAPQSGQAATAPPPLPEGLPEPPERPESLSDIPVPAEPESSGTRSGSKPAEEGEIEAPEAEEMPPPNAAGEKDEEEDADNGE